MSGTRLPSLTQRNPIMERSKMCPSIAASYKERPFAASLLGIAISPRVSSNVSRFGKSNLNINVKGVGQECPTHTGNTNSKSYCWASSLLVGRSTATCSFPISLPTLCARDSAGCIPAFLRSFLVIGGCGRRILPARLGRTKLRVCSHFELMCLSVASRLLGASAANLFHPATGSVTGGHDLASLRRRGGRSVCSGRASSAGGWRLGLVE